MLLEWPKPQCHNTWESFDTNHANAQSGKLHFFEGNLWTALILILNLWDTTTTAPAAALFSPTDPNLADTTSVAVGCNSC